MEVGIPKIWPSNNLYKEMFLLYNREVAVWTARTTRKNTGDGWGASLKHGPPGRPPSLTSSPGPLHGLHRAPLESVPHSVL